MKLNQQINSFVDSSRKNKEIRLKDFFLIFSAGKWIVWSSISFFFVFGLVYSLTSPNEYTTVSQVLTEQSRIGRSQLGTLAGLAGLGNNVNPEEVISPDLYPVILTNNNFLLELAKEEYSFEEHGLHLSLVEYFAKYEKTNSISRAKNGIVRGIKGLFKKGADTSQSLNQISDTPSPDSFAYQRLTATELNTINKLKDRILIEKLDRVITISTKMPNPKVSAILNRKIIDYLVNYVTAVQTDRERSNTKFIEERLVEAEDRFESAQMRLASFKDSNRGFVFEIDQSHVQKLQTELSLASEIYNTISQQHELAKIKLQESKPVLTVLQDPILPLTPSEPNVMAALIVFSFLGFFIGVLIISFKIIREFFRQA